MFLRLTEISKGRLVSCKLKIKHDAGHIIPIDLLILWQMDSMLNFHENFESSGMKRVENGN